MGLVLASPKLVFAIFGAAEGSFIIRGRLINQNNLRVFVLHPGHPGNTPLGNEPERFKITRFYPNMRLNGVNTQWV